MMTTTAREAGKPTTTIGNAPAAAFEETTFDIDVSGQFSGTGGIGQNLDPAGPLIVESAEMHTSGGGCSYANIVLRNEGSETVAVKKRRVNVYTYHGHRAPPRGVEVEMLAASQRR